MTRFLAAITIALATISCASGPPTAEELASADYGTPISQLDAQNKARDWLKGYLKDPLSAQCDWKSVAPGWCRTSPITGGRMIFGYRLDAMINARNSFAAYTGYKPYWFIFKNGELEDVWGQDELGSGSDAVPYMAKLK
jgi:hypothetical protein